jgi:hypothetical protein
MGTRRVKKVWAPPAPCSTNYHKEKSWNQTKTTWMQMP